ncbi:MAG: InlB B-repeat-containing protein [Treponema sp.]|nr:InlB B-repeat-containing protein [Treponema sp.]
MKKAFFNIITITVIIILSLAACDDTPPASAEYWNISWHLNGGVTAGGSLYPDKVEKGALLAAPTPPPAKIDNTFGGWFSDAGLSVLYNFSNPVTGNLNLYAKWTPSGDDDECDICGEIDCDCETGDNECDICGEIDCDCEAGDTECDICGEVDCDCETGDNECNICGEIDCEGDCETGDNECDICGEIDCDGDCDISDNECDICEEIDCDCEVGDNECDICGEIDCDGDCTNNSTQTNISLADFTDINVPSISAPTIYIVESAEKLASSIITVNDASLFDAGSIKWYYNGQQISAGISGSSGEILTVSSSVYNKIGQYQITVEVKIDGKLYSKIVIFEVKLF